jgi:lipopolysaccharide transport system ATP-binding protein
MSQRVIVENVCLDIPIIDPNKSFRSTLKNRYIGGSINTYNNEIVSIAALKDISFTLNSKDRLGLIGHNGAGKTTLLSVLAGIYKPVKGLIKFEGRVTPLFNSAPGIDMDDTGIENIRTIGMYLGMTKSEIEEKTPEIIEFTELEDYINLPLRTYSSGMVARLGFAVATAIRPEILLLDEGITVGDHRFAAKARERVTSFYDSIDVLICASHSNELLRGLCNKGLLLEHGKVKMYGEIDAVIDAYMSSEEVVA